MSASTEQPKPRERRPVGEFDSREPSDPALAAEGWQRWGIGDAIDTWAWLHEKSRRSVNVRLQGDAWLVVVQLHDERGNPAHQLCTFLRCGGQCETCRACWEELGPYPLLAEAMRVARGIRRSIVEESPVRVFSEQVPLFGDPADVIKVEGGGT